MAEQQQHGASAPLLGNERQQAADQNRRYFQDDSEFYDLEDDVANWHWARRLQRACAIAMASRRKHFLVMAAVALDASTLLASIFIQLIACETQQADEPWVNTVTTALEVVGRIFSCLFMVELILCVYAFGWRYVSSFLFLLSSFSFMLENF